jgi:hypothetical protein
MSGRVRDGAEGNAARHSARRRGTTHTREHTLCKKALLVQNRHRVHDEQARLEQAEQRQHGRESESFLRFGGRRPSVFAAPAVAAWSFTPRSLRRDFSVLCCGSLARGVRLRVRVSATLPPARFELFPRPVTCSTAE